MEDTRVARRYAQAVYEIAVKHDLVASVEDDLTAFGTAIENDAATRAFFFAPFKSRQEKIELLEAKFSDRITAVSLGLIRLMINKGRERELAVIPEEYRRLRREQTGAIHVHVTSSIELSEKQKTDLTVKLQKSTGRKIEADFEVDKSVIGGIKVAYNNSVVDGTVQGSLTRLRDQFRHNVLIQA